MEPPVKKTKPTAPPKSAPKKSLSQKFYEGNKALYDGQKALVNAIMG